MLKKRYWNQKVLTDIKSTSFHTKVGKIETDKNVTSFPSLACITKTLKLCLKVPTFNVDDPNYRPVFYFILRPERWMFGSLGYS